MFDENSDPGHFRHKLPISTPFYLPSSDPRSKEGDFSSYSYGSRWLSPRAAKDSKEEAKSKKKVNKKPQAAQEHYGEQWQGPDPFQERQDPFQQRHDPFQQQRHQDPFQQHQRPGPFQQQQDPFRQQQDPNQQQQGPFQQQQQQQHQQE
jgi:hypothetical protein